MGISDMPIDNGGHEWVNIAYTCNVLLGGSIGVKLAINNRVLIDGVKLLMHSDCKNCNGQAYNRPERLAFLGIMAPIQVPSEIPQTSSMVPRGLSLWQYMLVIHEAII